MTIMEEPANSEGLCEVKATVPTGLEVGASEECQEVLGRPAQSSRGRITFSIHNLEELMKVVTRHLTKPCTFYFVV